MHFASVSIARVLLVSSYQKRVLLVSSYKKKKKSTTSIIAQSHVSMTRHMSTQPNSKEPIPRVPGSGIFLLKCRFPCMLMFKAMVIFKVESYIKGSLKKKKKSYISELENPLLFHEYNLLYLVLIKEI